MINGDEAEHKRVGELAYWSERKDAEGALKNSWFERFYTDHSGLTRDDYMDKRVLDIGCGPRGSLEWATMTRQRVGVDPLADDYFQMGAADHAMTYVAAGAESIPLPDHSFDIVCSFNSLDHVDDLEAAIAEMKRLTAVGGLLLVITDVHDKPTPQEPICFGWDVVELFAPEFAVQSLRCCEKQSGGAYASAETNLLFDHADTRQRYGVLLARFMRVEVPLAPEDPVPEPDGVRWRVRQWTHADSWLPPSLNLRTASRNLAVRSMNRARTASKRLGRRAARTIRNSRGRIGNTA